MFVVVLLFEVPLIGTYILTNSYALNVIRTEVKHSSSHFKHWDNYKHVRYTDTDILNTKIRLLFKEIAVNATTAADSGMSLTITSICCTI